MGNVLMGYSAYEFSYQQLSTNPSECQQITFILKTLTKFVA